MKLNLDFDVEPDQRLEIVLDLDASRSIRWTPKDYQTRPTFRAFKKVLSGTATRSAPGYWLYLCS